MTACVVTAPCPSEGSPDEPLAKAVVGACLCEAATMLADSRFADLFDERLQQKVMNGLETLLLVYAQDPLDRLVEHDLGKRNKLWGASLSLAPSKAVAQARRELASRIDATGGSVLDEAAPLLRAELARQTKRFVGSIEEMCERIWADRHQIAALMPGGGHELGRIADMSPLVDGCHDGGRHTAVLCCEAGRFVYKPHDCQVDLWFADLAQRFVPNAFRQPATIVRADSSGAWGFQEFISHRPVSEKGGVSRYWRNMGHALALLQVLGSQDLHCRNFVAAGERPSLIDAESVLMGVPSPSGRLRMRPGLEDASEGFARDLQDTIVDYSMLSGLHGGAHNTSPLIQRGAGCLPTWEGEEYDVLGYQNELLSGLDEGLALLASRADEVARAIRRAEHIPIRMIIRDTHVYAKMLLRLCKNDAYDPLTRQALLEGFVSPASLGTSVPWSPLASAETACLAQGDVPFFSAEAGSCLIFGRGGVFDGELLSSSAVERALGRVRLLDEPHRSFAHAVVRLNVHYAQTVDAAPLAAYEPSGKPLDSGEALREAQGILDTLEGMIVESPSGESSWLFRDDAWHALAHSTISFANGLGGMALYMAALSTRTFDGRARDTALLRLDDCLERISEAITFLSDRPSIPAESLHFGMADGLGGIVRSLCLVGRVLGGAAGVGTTALGRSRDLLRQIVHVLEGVRVEHAIGQNVHAGCAGLLLALAQCQEAHDECAAHVAGRLAQRLIALREPLTQQGAAGDAFGTGRRVSGFGNGEAGIAVALLSAKSAFGTSLPDVDLCSPAADALSWEVSRLPAMSGARTRQREASGGASSGSIHAGPTGLGQCALTTLASTDDEALRTLARELLAHADQTGIELPPHVCDSFCGGTLSVAEYLLSRGRRVEACRVLGGMVDRRRAVGGFVFASPNCRQTDEPGLLCGLAGVGYELLRCVDPSLPCVFVD